MMSTMSYDKPEDYQTFIFDTWYHEDTPDPGVDENFLKGKISFYTFFEKIK